MTRTFSRLRWKGHACTRQHAGEHPAIRGNVHSPQCDPESIRGNACSPQPRPLEIAGKEHSLQPERLGVRRQGPSPQLQRRRVRGKTHSLQSQRHRVQGKTRSPQSRRDRVLGNGPSPLLRAATIERPCVPRDSSLRRSRGKAFPPNPYVPHYPMWSSPRPISTTRPDAKMRCSASTRNPSLQRRPVLSP